MDVPSALSNIRSKAKLSQQALAHLLGVSFVSVNRWERGVSVPSPAQAKRILDLYHRTSLPQGVPETSSSHDDIFASRGVRRHEQGLPLFDKSEVEIALLPEPGPPILDRLIYEGRYFSASGHRSVSELLERHQHFSSTATSPPSAGMSAGKNTYTYDAHTYHTKVPPQGIAELLRHYLPQGGLILDPFAGSGMTGVAARATGYDCILNELSPAACFIADRFVSTVSPLRFEAAVKTILGKLRNLRSTLYTTTCRECGRPTEILYIVWSYNVHCNHCGVEFLLWDRCRKYGRRVREHKILTEFECPSCRATLKKSHLKRTFAEPVQIAYMCCGSRQKETVRPLSRDDLAQILALEMAPPVAEGFVPTATLPDGVNLRQPKYHGLDRISRFYTPRNLAALSHLWKTIHHIDDADLASHLAFVFTSLYQRVTRLSEFRFWGGSGNTARFNVPFIFNEANVFITFARKARTIQDHLETTALRYTGKAVIVQNSATRLDYLPDESIDLIFTDPPFGANINYSEMNFLWESWLGRYTDTSEEAIINRVQGKDIGGYGVLMKKSLEECFRVLRSGHWLLLVFMNSSARVWNVLREAILDAGFEIKQADTFDKHHGTFKQFVSENTAGYDLVLHCLKPTRSIKRRKNGPADFAKEAVFAFLNKIDLHKRTNAYLHVNRKEELDIRKLYSEWTAKLVLEGASAMDFSRFRSLVVEWLSGSSSRS
ncbi:MAG: DNA methyltransferase [bacterium]